MVSISVTRSKFQFALAVMSVPKGLEGKFQSIQWTTKRVSEKVFPTGNMTAFDVEVISTRNVKQQSLPL